MTFSSFLESAQGLNLNSINDLIFHSSYYPAFFFIQCLNVCLYLRLSPRKPGLKWWRSISLGFLLAYGPRLAFSWLISRNLPEKQNGVAYITYLISWVLLNICPFDLFYKFLSRVVSRSILAILAEFGNGQLLIHYLWNSANAYPDHPITSLYVSFVPYTVTMIVEYIDNVVFDPKRRFMLYPYTYLKRIFLMAAAVIVLSQPNFVLEQSYLIDMYRLIPLFATMNGLFKLLDIVFAKNPYQVFDILFPSEVMSFIFTYHAEKQ